MALQIQVYKEQLFTPPTENRVKVSDYISKPLIAETTITVEEKPKQNLTNLPSPALAHASNAEIIGTSYEQCVGYAKRVTGINKTLGYAGYTKPEGYEPQIGSIALEVSYGHAMAVENILQDGIVVTEANFIRGAITRRFVPYWDIRGYIY